jgi:7-cyano-7-deazaguanine reductase
LTTNLITQLGKQTQLPSSPHEARIEVAPNPCAGDYLARFTVPEFTSLCPVTGQPDFARLVIDYVPREWILESKSLKLFMGSFRNHGSFHEACTVMIGERLVEAAAPYYMRVCGFWYARGGIPIDVFWQHGKLPTGVYLPEPGVPPYAGR